jgi:hypothetical protein
MMEHGRRTSWTGRPRPQHVSAREFSRTLRVTTPIVLPASVSVSHLPVSSKTPSSATLARSVRYGFPPFLTGLPRPVFAKGSPRNTPFLTGSGSQTEFPVTHSKQTTDKILTGARMHIRIFEILQISAQNDDATSVVIPLTLTKEGSEAVSAGPPKSTASRAWGRGHEVAGISPFLTETAQHSEIVVTHSKQSTGEFLTETRIACRHYLNSDSRRSKFKQTSQRVCSYNVIALPSAPSLFRRRSELHHKGKPDFGSNLASKILNSN